MGEKREGSGGEGGGKWGERGRELGMGYPPVHPLHILHEYFPSSTLKITLCTSRRTQLQHSFEIRISFVILR